MNSNNNIISLWIVILELVIIEDVISLCLKAIDLEIEFESNTPTMNGSGGPFDALEQRQGVE